MGLAIGVFMCVFGMGLLIIPFIIDLVVSRRQTDNTDYKRALEASAVLIIIAGLFLVGGIVYVGFESGWGIAKSSFSGAEKGLVG